MRKIAEWKKKQVAEIKNLIDSYPKFGVINMENIPTLQLQRIKKQLKDNLVLKMTKKRLIKLALDDLKEKKNIDKVKDSITGMPALVFTKLDPFKLQKILNKNISSAPAKVGQIAPNDIIIPKGPTSFAPGPIIGELGQLGIKTEVKEGKVVIRDDKLLIKEGQVIGDKEVDVLNKLKIEPMKVGLKLLLAYDDGLIYGKDVLDIDEEIYIMELKNASRDSLNLAVSVGYICKETIGLLIRKASSDFNILERKVSIEKPKVGVKPKEPKKEFVEERKEEKTEKEIEEEKPVEKEEVKEKPKEEIKGDTFEDYKKKKKITAEKLLEESKEETKEVVEKMKKEKVKKETLEKEEKKRKEVEELAKKIIWGEAGRK